LTDSPDVLIVGGGVIGCAVAWDAARRGLRVTVIERNTPGAAATSAAAGMLSPLGETQPDSPLGRLATASYDLYPDFVARLHQTTGIDVEYREHGKLHVAFTAAEESSLARLAAAAGHRGVRFLDAHETRVLEPALSEVIRSALLIDRDARIDNRRLGHAVWHAAEHDGVTFHIGRAVQSVEQSRTGRFLVRLDGESRIEASAVVIAAGSWSNAIRGVSAPPVRPVRGQMLAVATTLLHRTIHGHGCYLVPRDDGRTLVGATVEEAGFEPGPTPAGIRQLLDAALHLVPALGDARLVETWAGYRPATPDELPILGEDPDMPKLYWATGHFRNGILLAPITAEIIGRVLTGDDVPDIEPFSMQRFR
jgi:glycine oxidase